MPSRPAELAEARCRAYALFARLALDGVTETVLPQIDAVPSLQDALPRRADGDVDRDAAGVAHYEALTREVFPYQSVFVTPEAMPGGAETDRVAAFFRDIGCGGTPAEPSVDHAGALLAAMASLCAAEAEAWVDGRGDVAQRVRALQVEWHDEHFLQWWPALLEALTFAEIPLYRAWAEAVTELVYHHRDELGGEARSERPAPAAPTLPERLEADDAGLNDIAAVLLTPLASGLFLSHGALRRAARAHRVPGGFGDRHTVLTNLLRGAATYEAFGALVEQLDRRWSAALAFHRGYAREAAPIAAAHGRWAGRCDRTRAGLARLRASAGTG